jgi:hypothetical protein
MRHPVWAVLGTLGLSLTLLNVQQVGGHCTTGD